MRLIFAFLFLSLSSLGQTDSLTLMSWNVFLRPAILGDQQMERVDSVAAYLDYSKVDVLVLQEVFHKRARKRLCLLLKSSYPYHTESGPKSFWRVPSGVVVFSKYPIESEVAKSFKKGKGSDAMARKGVIRATVKINEKRVEVYGTHMQAGRGSKRENIRQLQLNTIHGFAQEGNDSLPQIFAGDFNISAKSAAKDSILEKLQVQLPEVSSYMKFTANFNDQSLMTASGTPKWIDFILLKNKSLARIIETKIQEPRMSKNGELLRISDHNPIISHIVLD